MSYHITDQDIYLFHQGTNYYSYKMLGNHYIKWKNTYGFRFAVWAPHAKAVSVVGDFNNWDESKHPLTKITNEGLWAGFITNVFEYSNYKYAIRTANNDVILKADPYARQAELRPKTASVTRNRMDTFGMIKNGM